MMTFEGFAMRGDSGTFQSEEQAKKIQLMGARKLRERWERQQWQSRQVDFPKDKPGRAALSDEQRGNLVRLQPSFFIGVERAVARV